VCSSPGGSGGALVWRGGGARRAWAQREGQGGGFSAEKITCSFVNELWAIYGLIQGFLGSQLIRKMDTDNMLSGF
jgi:hypothetical protein